MKLFLSLFFVLSLNLYAVNFFGMTSKNWKSIDEVAKLTYMMGVFDGLTFAEWNVHNTTLNVKVDITEYINGVDKLTEDYRNANIPVPFLLRVITLELNGETKETVEEALRLYRIQFSKYGS
ncbi:hypothetical protein N5T78_08095 [Aliarcobacter cryaerophilus]|uniref:hypothetical protein n=1 Tax=Aliarcobacter cryaerophilus TaxID=28198 RepID=UPI0021B570E8|nr:hypothetical protein [Aliarcobacter cryaerophilus]MCT7466535.1 hypothetical protein [Aliarcobacter cryaerophilus]